MCSKTIMERQVLKTVEHHFLSPQLSKLDLVLSISLLAKLFARRCNLSSISIYQTIVERGNSPDEKSRQDTPQNQPYEKAFPVHSPA